MPERVPTDKSHLIAQKRTIHGKTKIYQATRYLALPELKHRLKEFLGEHEKESYRTRYVKKQLKNPANVDVFSVDEIEEVLEPNKKGEKVFHGYNTKLISKVIEFKKPEEVRGVEKIICLKAGRNRAIYTDKITEERAAKKFNRVKKMARNPEKLKKFKERYQSWMNRKKIVGSTIFYKKKQLGTVLALMAVYDIRVGSGLKGGLGGIEEGLIKVEDLKRGMVVLRKDAPLGTIPRIVVEREIDPGVKRIFLRSLQKETEVKKLKELTSEFNKLKRKVEKFPDDKELKAELDKVDRDKRALETAVDMAMSPNWKEMIRVGHYGATQLEARHVKYPAPGEVWLDFIGKSNIRWNKKIDDPDIAESIKELQKGKTDKEKIFPDIKYNDVAKEWKKVGALPKDIRTYDGTKTFVEEANNFPQPTTKKELREIEKEIFKNVSTKLHNTPGMAKNKYTNPLVYNTWKSGALQNVMTNVGTKIKKAFLYVILDTDDLVKSYCWR